MKKVYILVTLFLAVTITSCKKESLQGYFIKTEEKPNFVRLDLSTSLLTSYLEENTTEEEKNTFKSIQKVNIAFLPQNKATEAEITEERETLSSVMNNTNYKSLMRINDKRGKATIYYAGEVDAIDEIVAVGYAKEFGVGVARILGKDMNPNKIMMMLQKAKIDKNSKGLEKLKDIFGGELQTEKIKVEPKE
ncbi:uncharacterized protein DUF4252 [Tenacibaculum adriaticum]|uniref:Uncharacterized protein DUF4252 n=1 Tax=Tenacibaculum adriaticum TaxID=413713 RepID=A0A5S5DTT8_9FLAO|nr:DUF4252 domain-containing protein [Tenacibaculum adriaticum]TYP99195.1 uncharacterized protein DUF4252 [Tenacibaculum adriaticum]